jgi:LacI family transcriptional regulator
MAVAGFDDIPTLRDVRPALTTVRLPLVELGRRALVMALDGPAADGDAEGDQVVVSVAGEVVVRESTPQRPV